MSGDLFAFAAERLAEYEIVRLMAEATDEQRTDLLVAATRPDFPDTLQERLELIRKIVEEP